MRIAIATGYRWVRYVSALGFLVAPIPPESLHARKVAINAGEKDIARCIARSSANRRWLYHSLWGLRAQEAGWIGAAIKNTDGSYDLGPMQINSWWIPSIALLTGWSQAQVHHGLRYDPCFNVEAARWIFLDGLRRSRNYWKAVGMYHSPTPWRQMAYARSVESKMRKRSLHLSRAGMGMNRHPQR